MVTAEAGGGAGVRRAESLVEKGVFGRYYRDIRVDELLPFSIILHCIMPYIQCLSIIVRYCLVLSVVRLGLQVAPRKEVRP